MQYTSLSTLCSEYTLQHVIDSYFSLLSHLTVAPVVSVETFRKCITEIIDSGVILVAYTIEDGRIFIHGTATLLYETKLIHGCKKVGHIEDVVVSPDYRGQGIAKYLIRSLVQLASASCYKVILDCTEDLIPFYEKCYFEHKGVQMAHYFK